MSNKPFITKQIELSEMTIYPNETFTLFLSKNKRAEERDCVQLEARINKGVIELFISSDNYLISSFDEWYDNTKEQTNDQ